MNVLLIWAGYPATQLGKILRKSCNEGNASNRLKVCCVLDIWVAPLWARKNAILEINTLKSCSSILSIYGHGVIWCYLHVQFHRRFQLPTPNAHLMSTAHQHWQQFGESDVVESNAALVTAAPHFRSWSWKQFIVKSLLAKQHHS